MPPEFFTGVVFGQGSTPRRPSESDSTTAFFFPPQCLAAFNMARRFQVLYRTELLRFRLHEYCRCQPHSATAQQISTEIHS